MTDINTEYKKLFAEFPELGLTSSCIDLVFVDSPWTCRLPTKSVARDSLRQWIESKGFAIYSYPAGWSDSATEHMLVVDKPGVVSAVRQGPTFDHALIALVRAVMAERKEPA